MSASLPLLSIIIPTYNSAEYLRDAIESIVQQKYAPAEIIIIDDGSTDNTLEIVNSYSQVRYFHQDNSGPAAARNFGISMSKGEYLGFHDADDLSDLNRFQTQMEILLNEPQIEFCLTRIKNFIQPNKNVSPELITEDLLKPRMGFISSMVIRREALERIGLFDESYQHAEDIEWLQRAQKMNSRYLVLLDVLIDRRIHDKNLSAQIKQGHESLMRLLRSSVSRE